MNINKIGKLMRIYNSNGAKKVQSAGGTCKKDELKLSGKAVEFQWAMTKIKEIPDIRQDKVDKIKDEISTGAYKVDGKKIVEKMLENVDFDKKV